MAPWTRHDPACPLYADPGNIPPEQEALSDTDRPYININININISIQPTAAPDAGGHSPPASSAWNTLREPAAVSAAAAAAPVRTAQGGQPSHKTP